MPNTFALSNLQSALRAIGRAVVFRAAYWPGNTNLALTHLGDTEGDIAVAPNESFVHLTTPELTGPAKHKSYVAGEDPVVTLPLYMADPALRAIISPTGSASGGYGRQRPVVYHTLVLFPEELFFNVGDDAYASLVHTGSAWTVGGDALTADQQRLLDLSMWFWRGYFTKPGVPFRHGDAGKAVESVTFQVCQDSTKPDGNQLYTVGDPADALIDIHPVG